MVTFQGDLTDPPNISTSDPSGTLMSWVGYVLVGGAAITALAIAQATVSPAIQSGINAIPVIGERVESDEGGFQV